MSGAFKLKAVVTMSTVCALGAILGASLSGILVSRNVASSFTPRKNDSKIIEELRTRLKLSPEQTQRMDSILDEAHRQVKQLHLSVKLQFEGIRKTMRSGIRQMLNDEQRREFEAMIREREDLKARREKEKTGF